VRQKNTFLSSEIEHQYGTVKSCEHMQGKTNA